MSSSLKKILSVALLASIVVSSSSTWAGCPYYPPEPKDLILTSCRFYVAEKDNEFRAKIDAYFTPGWDNATPEKIAEYKSAAMKRNTGAIFSAKLASAAAVEEFFLLSDDASICDKFKMPGTHRFGVQPTCRMIFFAAPTSQVLSPRPPGETPASIPSYPDAN